MYVLMPTEPNLTSMLKVNVVSFHHFYHNGLNHKVCIQITPQIKEFKLFTSKIQDEGVTCQHVMIVIMNNVTNQHQLCNE